MMLGISKLGLFWDLKFGVWIFSRCCFSGFWILMLGSFCALATSPDLKSITPPGGQRGTELEIILNGERLEDAQEIINYEPGFEILKLNSVTNITVKAQVKISSDCPLGEHHLRLRTRGGLSALRTFQVGPFPVVAREEIKNDQRKAQRVALDTTISGAIREEDMDSFEVEARKGQRISAEVEGMRLGRGVFDPRLVVLDPKGAVLADVEDTWLGIQDPFISFRAPEDGIFTFQLRARTCAGNDKCQYLLHIGSFPRPSMVTPLAGRLAKRSP